MSKWLNLIERDESKIPDFITHFENELKVAKDELEIGDRLIAESRKLPHIVDFRFGQLQEIEAVYEYLNIQLKLSVQSYIDIT